MVELRGVSKVWMAELLRYNLVDRTLMCLEFCWQSNEDSGLSSEWVGLTKGVYEFTDEISIPEYNIMLSEYICN